MGVMADNIKGIPFSSKDEGIDFPTQAKLFVQAETKMYNVDTNRDEMLDLRDIYVVSFTYILGGWKAMVSTSIPDGRYYEVTHKPEHDGTDGPECTYVDTYVKIKNTKYSLEGEPNA